jgi:hypothetical protein
VIIGRGKRVRHHPANVRLRALIESQLEAYSNAATKGLKSNILWKVLHEVRSYSPSRLGFVKRESDTGRWYAIDDASAKVNISQAFRDGLANFYKSSKTRKQRKRKKSLDEECATEGESQPSNRVRVSLNKQIAEVSEPADHTIVRLGANMDRLRQFLHGPTTTALEAEPNERNLNLKAHPETHSWDTFSKLFTNFGRSTNMSGDPFEPKPIALHVPSSAAVTITKPPPALFSTTPKAVAGRNSIWDETNDTGFPFFATWDMADLTDTPDNLSVNSAILDSVSCSKEAMMPSILSLNSPDFDSGTLGMTSFSSLSDISDNQDLQDIWDACKSTQKARSKACSV